MILESLVRYYQVLEEEGKAPKPGWCDAKVSFAIRIRKNGELAGITSLKEAFTAGKKTLWRPQMLKVPEMVSRSSGVSANFLCDNSKYLLGIDASGSGKRVLECFEAAKEKHLDVLENANSEMAEAIKNFFKTWNPLTAKELPELMEIWEELTEGGNLIFELGAVYAQEDEEIKKVWDELCENKDGIPDGICLVTGKKASISRIHNTVKGVQGAQSSGAALVSFNAPAFESYGKEQSYNAPVGKYAAFAYTTALNYLLSQKEHSFRIGDTTVVCWAENGQEIYQDMFWMSAEPPIDNQEILQGMFRNLEKGQAVDLNGVEINPEQRFYILGLAPNAARLSIRFFYQDDFGNIIRNFMEHYGRAEIVRPQWAKKYMGIRTMLEETVNKNAKDKSPVPNMAAEVFRAILSGDRYPESLFYNTLLRIRAEQGTVSTGRASIVKAYLSRNKKLLEEKEELFVGINEECNDVAYLLGREFAVLENIQEEASPAINATIKDRYFNAACATPASVFAILFKLKNSHIRKISEGRKIYFEKLLTNLQCRLSAIPARLSLEEQGMFILGYYHQVQKRYEKKEEK